MKIGVLTLHRVKNYGSVLQTYAVSEVLKKKGHDVEIIDYIPERMKPLPDLVYVREDRYTTNDGKKNLPKKYILILRFSVSYHTEVKRETMLSSSIPHNL